MLMAVNSLPVTGRKYHHRILVAKIKKSKKEPVIARTRDTATLRERILIVSDDATASALHSMVLGRTRLVVSTWSSVSVAHSVDRLAGVADQ